MGTPRPPTKALLFVGTLFAKENPYRDALQILQGTFGEIALESPPFPWDFSDYYRDEIGEPLYRRFIFFKRLVDQDQIAAIKLMTHEMERSLSEEGKRTINLDPGYLTPAKIILASTKDYSHRIYLRDGVYAEVTLIFKEGEFIPHINTYRDYRDERYLRLFMTARILFSVLSQERI